MNAARLLFPALRWSETEGYDHESPTIERALELGVGGFLIFGGEARAVRGLTDELRRRAGHDLLIASDLERGAGQQFRGATSLPPAAAIAALGRSALTRGAGELTAREARALGVDWVLAPVADVDLEPENPIVGTRAFGTDPPAVARQVGEWVRGCRRGGALSCAKHFPGHGRTRSDSHVERPSVSAGLERLAHDLLPFRAAIAAGVDSIMTAHVAFAALDPSGRPATLSPPILDGLLRQKLGFRGLIVTDALVMEGLVQGADEPTAACQALRAGCDALLYPGDLPDLVRALTVAVEGDPLLGARVGESLRRIARAAATAASQRPAAEWGREEDRLWALDLAIASLRTLRGEPRLPPASIRLVEIDDDLGGPHPPPSRATFPAALRAAGVELASGGRPVLAIYADIRGWKGRPGLSYQARQRVRLELEAAPEATVVLFGHPRLASELPWARHLLVGWGGEPLMQQAVAVSLTHA